MSAAATPSLDLTSPPFGDLLDSIAAKQPTPGGGAVAALVGAISAALGSMVVAYSRGRKALAPHANRLESAGNALDAHRARAIELAAEDARAYGALNELWKRPADDPVRVRDMPAAVQAAIDAPMAAAQLGLETLSVLERLVGHSNRHLGSDLAIAAILAEAAVRSALWNVRINLPMLDDAAAQSACEATIESSLKRAAAACRSIEDGVRG
ncbi:MAG: cyclodeaminase/cyclohydrolase family protein [Phycisphaerales bacterium]